jgi:hypothetical protein
MKRVFEALSLSITGEQIFSFQETSGRKNDSDGRMNNISGTSMVNLLFFSVESSSSPDSVQTT